MYSKLEYFYFSEFGHRRNEMIDECYLLPYYNTQYRSRLWKDYYVNHVTIVLNFLFVLLSELGTVMEVGFIACFLAFFA